jgi:hypothetical protein
MNAEKRRFFCLNQRNQRFSASRKRIFEKSYTLGKQYEVWEFKLIKKVKVALVAVPGSENVALSEIFG